MKHLFPKSAQTTQKYFYIYNIPLSPALFIIIQSSRACQLFLNSQVASSLLWRFLSLNLLFDDEFVTIVRVLIILNYFKRLLSALIKRYFKHLLLNFGLSRSRLNIVINLLTKSGELTRMWAHYRAIKHYRVARGKTFSQFRKHVNEALPPNCVCDRGWQIHSVRAASKKINEYRAEMCYGAILFYKAFLKRHKEWQTRWLSSNLSSHALFGCRLIYNIEFFSSFGDTRPTWFYLIATGIQFGIIRKLFSWYDRPSTHLHEPS